MFSYCHLHFEKIAYTTPVLFKISISITYYDLFINAQDESDKALSLKNLVDSFCKRIKELSQREYQNAQEVTTLDFVLMFTPIESALSIIIQSFEQTNKKSLFEYAWEKGVIISSPITLMPILKTIDLCWKSEYQNRHAQRIAEEASDLYEQFARFVTKLQNVGDSIKKSQNLFDEAKKTLSEGRGNLIRRTENMRKLLKKEKKFLTNIL